MAGLFFKWLIPGLVAVGGGTALAIVVTGATMRDDLGARAAAALDQPEYRWAAVSVDGRGAVLTGTATTKAMIDAAATELSGVHGIGSVSDNVTLAEFISPFPFAASLTGGTVTLSGGFPDPASHAAILAKAPGAVDEMRLLSGGPNPKDFATGASFALDALGRLDEGEVRLADLALSVTGRARSQSDFDALATLRTKLPAALTLAQADIAPPLAVPFVWHIKFDGKSVSISGNTDSATMADQLRATAPGSPPVSTNLTLASGAPRAFDANVLILLKAVLQLESGEAKISDDEITLSGSPSDAATADAVTAAVSAIGGTSTLGPARVAQFSFAATKAAGGVTYLGFVPDEAARDRLAAPAGADTSKLTLARGAPERFESGVDFGLTALAHLSEGEFTLADTRLAVSGRAATPADMSAIQMMLAEGPPQGFSLGSSEITPPIADPFLFVAIKSSDGKTSLTGYLPNEAARTTLQTAVANLATDGVTIADGAPRDFAASAAKGVTVLALLDSGKLSFDGKAWAIEGIVDTPKKGFAADAAYSIAGLRTAGWTYTVRQPTTETLPIIAPYVWGAQKTGDGHVTFTGFAPSQDFKDILAVKGGAGATDATTLGAGAPENFVGNATAGLEALLKLDEGSLGLAGSTWTLTGRIGSATARAQTQDALNGKIDPTVWRIVVQAPDAAPIVTPYLWVAHKREDGNVDLTGYLPSDALKQFVELRAIKIGRNSIELASGEPSGFSDDVLAGLDALTHLASGKAAFDGSKWTLTGRAVSDAELELAENSLLKGSKAGSLWEKSIEAAPVAIDPPSEMAVAEVASSEEPAPSASSSEAAAASSEEPSASSAEPSSEPLLSAPTPLVEPSASVSQEPQQSSEEPSVAAAIVAPEPRLVLPDSFAFEVSRRKDEGVALTGAVPDVAFKSYAGVLAGAASSNGLSVEATAPQSMVADASAAVGAVRQLVEGRAGFDGKTWWISGKAADEATRDSVLASIKSLPNSIEWKTDVVVVPAIDLCRDTIGLLAARNAIVFKSGSATLLDESAEALDELAADLRICPGAVVHVEGHTDGDGAEDVNLALSVARAEAVVEALIQRGVAVERLYAEGYGETMPVASNETKQGKQTNRRIAFTLSEGD